MTNRKCTTCNQILPLTTDFFYPMKNGKFLYYCRVCHNAYNRAYRKRLAGGAYKQERSKQAISEFVQAYKEGVK
jgi:hypothetical protein